MSNDSKDTESKKTQSADTTSCEADAFDRNNPPHKDPSDPLGERRDFAKQCWIEDGRPEDAHWATYWNSAEALFSHGKGMRMRLQQSDSALTVDEEVPASDAALSSAPVLVTSLAKLLGKRCDEHELFCIAQILQTSTITFSATHAIGPCTLDETLALLASLRAYCGLSGNESFLASLREQREADHPLSNHDRTTIARLTQQLIAETEVVSVVPVEKPKAVVESADGTISETEIK